MKEGSGFVCPHCLLTPSLILWKYYPNLGSVNKNLSMGTIIWETSRRGGCGK